MTADAVLDEKPVTKEDKYTLMRERYQACVDAETDIREDAIEDFKFIWIAGCQWDNNFGALRGDRPKYEFNKLRQAVKQIVNDIRQNTPAIKVRATKDGSTDMAEIRQGMMKNIESQSNADTVYDWAAMYSVSGGYGAWRVNRVYVDDDSFDQDIRIERVVNPFSIRFDPSARAITRQDAKFAFVEDDISRAEFKRRWPKAECRTFGPATVETLRHWFGEKDIKIAEYWQVVPVKKELLLLSDDDVVWAEDFDEKFWANPPPDPKTGQPMPPITVVDRRDVETTKVTSEIVSGVETLEGPFDWPGKFIPLVPVWGDLVHVDGRDEWYGMARHSRDAAILNNFALSTFAEQVASQPSAPFMYTAKQIEGYETEWSNLATNNAPGLPYNPDPDAPGLRPQREAPPQMSPGYMALLNITSDALKATTGLFDPSLGAKSNETSGKAIIARQREGDVANFDYSDSIARAIRYTGEIIDDLIPHVYVGKRQMRILGEDGAAKFVTVNESVQNPQTGEWETHNDLRDGKYDITISSGPSFTTQRMETLDAMMQLAQSQGPMAMLAQYGVLKNMDTPGMDEVRDGMRTVLVGQGLLQRNEKDPPAPPPQPDPTIAATVKLKDAQANKAAAETQFILAETPAKVMQAHANADKATADAFGSVPGPTGPGQPPINPNPPMPGAPIHMPPMAAPDPTQPPEGGFSLPGAPQ